MNTSNQPQGDGKDTGAGGGYTDHPAHQLEHDAAKKEAGRPGGEGGAAGMDSVAHRERSGEGKTEEREERD